MARVVRTEAAKSDVLEIAARIAADKPLAAERWVENVDRRLALIAKNPFMGEAVDYLAPGMRRHCLGNYLIFYTPIEGGIQLRRVLHGARRIENLF